jgi:ABC-2 type transport system permease protein
MEQKSENKSSVPNSLSQALTVAKYELLNYRRSRRFLFLGLIVLLIGVVATVSVVYLNPTSLLSSPLMFFRLWLDNSVWLVIILPAALLGGDAISSEFQNKTAYSMIGNPILRSSIYVGKWIAAFVASLVLLVFFEIITLGNGLCYFGNVPAEFWLSFLFSVMYLATAVSVAFLFSSLFKNSAFPVLLSGAALLLGFNVIAGVLSAMDVEPWFILSYAEQVITNIFIVPYPEHMTVAGNSVAYAVTIPQSLAIMAAYAAISLIISCLVFKKRDIA